MPHKGLYQAFVNLTCSDHPLPTSQSTRSQINSHP